MINDCRVVWIRGTLPYTSPGFYRSMHGYLSSIFQYILATTQDNFHGQFSHKKSCFPTQKDPSVTYFLFCQIDQEQTEDKCVPRPRVKKNLFNIMVVPPPHHHHPPSTPHDPMIILQEHFFSSRQPCTVFKNKILDYYKYIPAVSLCKDLQSKLLKPDGKHYR